MTRSGLTLLAVVLTLGCVGPDEDRLPPYEPLPAAARTPIYLSPTENVTASPRVADVAAPTRDMLATLLERTRRFVVVADPAGASRLDTAVDIYLDQAIESTVVHGSAGGLTPERHASVGLMFRWSDPTGAVLDAGEVTGTARELRDPLPLPKLDDLESGAYWNSTYGRATRDGLDRLIRRLAART